jgi:MFS superfamily sulfate permease-like transporter
MLPAGLGVGLMAFVESISAARAFRRPHDPPVDPDRELIALGAANVAGGFFRSYGAGGGLSQTAVNDDAGAKTQASELVTAAVVAMILVFFASLVADIPEATLGAIVLVAAIGLIDVAGLRALGRVRSDELVFGSITTASVLVLGTLAGLFVGVVVSLLSLFRHLNQPPTRVLGRQPGTQRYRDLALHPDGESEPGLLIVRVEGPLYFGNAQRVLDRIAGLVADSTSLPDVLLLDASAITDVDTTALAVLRERAERLAAAGTHVWFAAMTDTVLATARRTRRWPEVVADEETFPRVHDAVEAFRARSNPG